LAKRHAVAYIIYNVYIFKLAARFALPADDSESDKKDICPCCGLPIVRSYLNLQLIILSKTKSLTYVVREAISILTDLVSHSTLNFLFLFWL